MNLLYPAIQQTNSQLADKIKNLVAQHQVGFDQNTTAPQCYTSPFLYAYFNHLEVAKSVPLGAYTLGFSQAQGATKVWSNADGIAYIANVG